MKNALKPEKSEIIEREIVINNIRIHIKSVFSSQRSLDDAMKSIISRKLSEAKN